jgi:uncharacterized metal-binding protein
MSSPTDNALPDASNLVITQDKATLLFVGLAILVVGVMLYLLTDACLTWRKKRKRMKSNKGGRIRDGGK